MEVKRRGWRASAAFPIRMNDTVCGTLTVYANETGFFRDKELALLVEAAGDISFGLDNLARKEESQQAEQKVRQERDFSEAVINSLPGVFYLYDQNGKFLRWNKNFERVTGYGAIEISAMHPLDFLLESKGSCLPPKSMRSSRMGNLQWKRIWFPKTGD